MIETLNTLFLIIKILFAIMIIVILLLILISTFQAIYNNFKKNKEAKYYIKKAEKIIEKERNEK